MSSYLGILLHRRYLDLKLAVEQRNWQLLAAELRRAAEEHHTYEAMLGEPDTDWAAWYARFLLGDVSAPADHSEHAPSKEEISYAG